MRHYEQLVAVMRRDHEALIQQQREETAKQREQVYLCFTTGFTTCLTRSLLCWASVATRRRFATWKTDTSSGGFALLYTPTLILFVERRGLCSAAHTQHCPKANL